jgi:pyruvate, water dikinase
MNIATSQNSGENSRLMAGDTRRLKMRLGPFLAILALWGCNGNSESANDTSTDDTDTGEPKVWECVAKEGETPDFLQEIGCETDFEILASAPMDSSLPGARSVKTVIDQMYGDDLYFQNSSEFQIHYDFASANLWGDDRQIVGSLQDFNQENYTHPQRRFLLGAVTYYDGPGTFVYEIAPYDNSSAAMIEKAYNTIKDAAYFGGALYFHPTSEFIGQAAAELPDTVLTISTEELYEGIDYQALNLGESYGRLKFVKAAELAPETASYRDIVVLDTVPNDISVVAGIITAEFQTPLSHINVLSQNRNTPNMALRRAYENEALRALEDKWVRLEVGPFDYTVEEVDQEAADAWWEELQDTMFQPVDPRLDDTVTALTDIEDVLDLEALPLREAISEAIPAFGGKASHYGGLARIKEANAPKAFVIPVYYYLQFMEQNGFDERVTALMEDSTFMGDAAARDAELEALRDDMLLGEIDGTFFEALIEKLVTEYPNTRMRFRSSTNAEDLEDFTGAGLYTSKSGDPNDDDYPVEDALRTVWSSVWFFRAFEEREYRNINHATVGMAILVHHSFPDEEANGVALTANPFDTSGIMPGFYVNVQLGEASVVQPDPGIQTDQFILHYDMPNKPISFIEHSSLVLDGESVLTYDQTLELGDALKAIHQYFYEAYGPPLSDPTAWYAMDVEFKFDGEPGEEPILSVKQARPHPGR